MQSSANNIGSSSSSLSVHANANSLEQAEKFKSQTSSPPDLTCFVGNVEEKRSAAATTPSNQLELSTLLGAIPLSILRPSLSVQSIKNPVFVGAKRTYGGGDCAFHAALGEWDEVKEHYECKDLESQRKKVADAIRLSQPGDEIYLLIREAIQAMAMEGGHARGCHRIQIISRAYQDYLMLDQALVESAWTHFEEQLNASEHKDFNDYIQQNHQSTGDTLKSKFYDCLAKDGGLTYELIFSFPALQKAFDIYNETTRRGFNWDEHLQDTQAIEEYASYMQRPGNWLLPLEIKMMAHVLKITIEYYTLTPSRQTIKIDSFNPGQQITRAVQFDGYGHFDRYYPIEILPQAEAKPIDDHTHADPLPANLVSDKIPAFLEILKQNNLLWPSIEMAIKKNDVRALKNLHGPNRRLLIDTIHHYVGFVIDPLYANLRLKTCFLGRAITVIEHFQMLLEDGSCIERYQQSHVRKNVWDEILEEKNRAEAVENSQLNRPSDQASSQHLHDLSPLQRFKQAFELYGKYCEEYKSWQSAMESYEEIMKKTRKEVRDFLDANNISYVFNQQTVRPFLKSKLRKILEMALDHAEYESMSSLDENISRQIRGNSYQQIPFYLLRRAAEHVVADDKKDLAAVSAVVGEANKRQAVSESNYKAVALQRRQISELAHIKKLFWDFVEQHAILKPSTTTYYHSLKKFLLALDKKIKSYEADYEEVGNLRYYLTGDLLSNLQASSVSHTEATAGKGKKLEEVAVLHSEKIELTLNAVQKKADTLYKKGLLSKPWTYTVAKFREDVCGARYYESAFGFFCRNLRYLPAVYQGISGQGIDNLVKNIASNTTNMNNADWIRDNNDQSMLEVALRLFKSAAGTAEERHKQIEMLKFLFVEFGLHGYTLDERGKDIFQATGFSFTANIEQELNRKQFDLIIQRWSLKLAHLQAIHAATPFQDRVKQALLVCSNDVENKLKSPFWRFFLDLKATAWVQLEALDRLGASLQKAADSYNDYHLRDEINRMLASDDWKKGSLRRSTLADKLKTIVEDKQLVLYGSSPESIVHADEWEARKIEQVQNESRIKKQRDIDKQSINQAQKSEVESLKMEIQALKDHNKQETAKLEQRLRAEAKVEVDNLKAEAKVDADAKEKTSQEKMTAMTQSFEGRFSAFKSTMFSILRAHGINLPMANQPTVNISAVPQTLFAAANVSTEDKGWDLQLMSPDIKEAINKKQFKPEENVLYVEPAIDCLSYFSSKTEKIEFIQKADLDNYDISKFENIKIIQSKILEITLKRGHTQDRSTLAHVPSSARN